MVVTAVVATAVALGALLVLAAPALQRQALRQTADTLAAEARLMARVVEDALARGTSAEALDPVIDAAAEDVDARVTIVATDGRVLADSAVSGAALAALENHAGRPEVRAALGGQAMSLERHSATIGSDLLYAAVPVRSGGRIVGVARVSRGVGLIARQSRHLWWSAALALAVALGATGLLSLALSAPLGRTLREIMETARQLARGNLSARIGPRRDDELGELGRILNDTAEQLQRRLAEIARDRGRTDAILSALDDGVLAVDHRGTVVLANSRVAGELQPSAVGRHYLEVIRQHEVGALIEDVLRNGEPREAELELLHLGRVFAVAAVPFPADPGTPHGAVLTFDDVTERHRVERIRRDFVANASHELRTPLTSIRGFVEALEDGALAQPETAQRFLGKIRTHADRMAALVDDLLELSRLESGDRPPDWAETAVAEIAAEVVASAADRAARKRIALESADLGAPAVVSDPERLRRILENLVDNAVKYTPEGGHVALTASAGPDGAACLEVADDGPGIAAEHLERIFERFYRVDKARSRALGGTGLGLSIVRHLADSVGATVSVQSQPGRGTRFGLLVPRGPAPAREPPSARPGA
jgi:two-component system phosphate regulon sensor histidine kinase PhoR